MNIGRMFAGAIVRRLAVLLVGALLAWAGCDARAQTGAPPLPGIYPDQGQAYTNCWADAVNEKAQVGPNSGNPVCVYAGVSGQYGRYNACVGTTSNPDGCVFQASDGYHQYPLTATCSTRPTTAGGFYRSGTSPTMCIDGCAYGGGSGTTQMTVAGFTYLKTNGLTATGDVCSGPGGDFGSPVEAEECHTQGNLTQCVRADGKHCAVASTGKKFCWEPAENGTKHEGNEGATKSPGNTAINPPSKPPPNGGEWTQGGQGTVSVTNNNTTTTSTVTNWNSSYGNTGNGGGSTNPDGSENGNGDGDGDGDDDGNGPGPSTGESLGDLYTPTEDTAASLMQAFFNAAGDTALLSQINTFFGNCGYAGTCPQWTYETDYTGNMTFAQLCDGTIGDILSFAGFAVLAVAAFGAFRIAIY